MNNTVFSSDPQFARSALGPGRQRATHRNGGGAAADQRAGPPIPKAKKVRGKAVQADLLADEQGQEYNPTETINGIRSAVESWRNLPQAVWAATVTPTTAQLLNHWRSHPFANQKPFFCQVVAVETVIWLTEVAPERSTQGARFRAASRPEIMVQRQPVEPSGERHIAVCTSEASISVPALIR